MKDQHETNISLPKDLAEKLKKRAEEKGFKSLSNYAAYILRQVLSRIESEDERGKNIPKQKTEEEIKQNLRHMGYLD